MATLRNLSGSDILLNDIEGIVIQASSDYDLNEETWNDVANSNDLVNNINSGSIIFIDKSGNPLTQQESLDIQSGISITQPAVIVLDSGSTAAGGVHDILNFVGSGTKITSSGNNIIDISLLPGLEFNTIGGEQFLTLTDPTRNNKKLSVEVGRYLYNGTTINSTVWLYIIDIVTDPIAYSVPFNATIVGISTENEFNASGTSDTVTEYDLHVDSTLRLGSFVTITGDQAQKYYNNTLDIDVNANQILKIQGRRTAGSAGHVGVSIVLFLRWRV